MTNKNYNLLIPYINTGNPHAKLNRYVLFNLIKLTGEDVCKKCGQKIEELDEMTIAHINPWRKTDTREGNKDLFWDLDNLKFEHCYCNLTEKINKLGFRGISEHIYKSTGYKLYKAEICVDRKEIILGYHKDPSEAAKMYDLGVIKYRNGKGVLNFPEKREEYIERLKNDKTIK